MRTFIAIPLHNEAKKELSLLQGRFKKSDVDVKWVNPKDIHLTLRFLGDVEENKLTQIKRSLTRAVKKHGQFDLCLKKLSALPTLIYPKTIIVNANDEKRSCQALQKSVSMAIKKIGFEKEHRAFLPHITLGRVRSDKNKKALINLIEKEKDFSLGAKIPIKCIVLFSSLITQRGPVYSILEEFPLPEAC
jgi:RNA 2',3'-cyclic 3'-phosphodiesterase